MRMLFEIDKKDYKENGTVGIRPSVRGIIVRDGKLVMVHSLKYDYYKFPGGGAEEGEGQVDTLIREVKEESGLSVVRASVRAYGLVHRVQKGKVEDIFVQDNYYYLCDVEDEIGRQELDAYEAEEEFVPELVSARHAAERNRNGGHGEKDKNPHFAAMLEREVRVLEMLMEEGIVAG